MCTCDDVTRSLAVESTHPHSKSSKGETKGNKSFFINFILSFLKTGHAIWKKKTLAFLSPLASTTTTGAEKLDARNLKNEFFFLCSFQGRLSCHETPEMNCNSQVDVTDDDGEYLLMSLFRLEISPKKKLTYQQFRLLIKIQSMWRSDSFRPSRRFSLINWQHFWLFKKRRRYFLIFQLWWKMAQKGNTKTHADQHSENKLIFSSERTEHKMQVYLSGKRNQCVCSWLELPTSTELPGRENV